MGNKLPSNAQFEEYSHSQSEGQFDLRSDSESDSQSTAAADIVLGFDSLNDINLINANEPSLNSSLLKETHAHLDDFNDSPYSNSTHTSASILNDIPNNDVVRLIGEEAFIFAMRTLKEDILAVSNPRRSGGYLTNISWKSLNHSQLNEVRDALAVLLSTVDNRIWIKNGYNRSRDSVIRTYKLTCGNNNAVFHCRSSFKPVASFDV